LKPFGFSYAIVGDIFRDAINCVSTGRQFFSNTHRLVYDRKYLVLHKIETEPLRDYLIDEPTSNIDIPIRLKIEKFDRYAGFTPNTNPNIACLDADKLQYPLLLRKWKHGDSFRPLGMKNMKKLSDFFIDAKLSLIEKERRWILVSGGQIAWIVGLRIDDRFKITNKTRRVSRFELSTNYTS